MPSSKIIKLLLYLLLGRWLDNIKLLRSVDLTDKSTHLLYFDAALARHDARDVVQAFKSMSAREFKDYALGVPKREADLPDVSLSVADGEIKLDGTPFLSFEDDIPETERDFIGRLLQKAYRARAGNCVPHVVAVYDDGEARAVDNFLKKLRAGQ